MKSIYSIITATFILFGATLFPNQASAAVCQNKTVIVYSNGMFTERKAANLSKQKLKFTMIDASQVYGDMTKYEYHLAYANGKDGPVGTTGLEQLLEVARQAYGDKFIDLFWRVLTLSSEPVSAPWLVRLAMENIASSFNQSKYANDPDAIKMTDDYRTFLNEGKRILIVAHSQGNFYTNFAYDKLTTEKPAWASSIGVVAVATPASSSPGGKLGVDEPNITVPEDFVIGIVRNAFGSLPSKSDQWVLPGSSNLLELGYLSMLDIQQTTLGHNFVGWYLAGPYTRGFILNGIVQTLDGVNGYLGLQYPNRAVGPTSVRLDGVLPNAAATATLQYTVASGTWASPSIQRPSIRLLGGRSSLTIYTNSTCTGSASTSFTIDDFSHSPEQSFLVAIGYDKDRWRFNSVGPYTWIYPSSTGIHPSLSFPTLASLRAYADPRLLGTYFPYCYMETMVETTRLMSSGTTLNIYELFNPNAIKRCDPFAIYEAKPYFDGFNALLDDYYTAADKQAWAGGLLNKVKAYYGAGI